jgi:hypothetical protein
MGMRIEIDEAAKFDGMTLTEIKMVLKDLQWVTIDKSMVDSEQWHSIVAMPALGDWIRETYKDAANTLWIDTTMPNDRFYRFDVHDKIHTLMMLQWNHSA